MSQSAIIKLIIIGTLFVLPGITQARSLVFDEKTNDVNLEFTKSVKTFSIRNDFDLTLKTKQALLNQPYEKLEPLLSEASLEQVLEFTDELTQKSEPATMFLENNWATTFSPGQNALTVDTYELNQDILANLDPIRLSVIISPPTVRLSETNELGINELVATGESNFTGSSRSRITNIRVGSSRYNGLILLPGEEFSFNKFLGDINAANGYTPEIVIKGTELKKEFGGGLCQVSTTVFRAAMNAGLPITERQNHSFAVQYYSPAGTDATIYTGVLDFKFKNNLASHMLIQTRIEGTKLYYDFYGTKDDRVVELEDPYTYDRQANGAMKATWNRKVTLNGEVLKDSFHSTYRPPSLYKLESTVESEIPNPDAPKEEKKNIDIDIENDLDTINTETNT
ncbi:MAG: VanW family protein [bacterium]|nr:VanW family protein [bacterium]